MKSKTRNWMVGAIFLLGIIWGNAQVPFQIVLEEWTGNHNFPGVHSGAWGQWNGHWIFIGGRTNGLHGFLPPLAFPSSGILHEIWAYNPASQSLLTASLDSLPTEIFESVTASNLQFYQEASQMYLVGGYGWCDTANAFRTFPTLTAIDLNAVLDSLVAGNGVTSLFRQITDQRLAVTGGHLEKLDSTYHLVFGHRFDGMYDRTDSTGFFIQHYTHQIRKFQLFDDGDSLAIQSFTAITDSPAFRRRDYNLVPQVIAGGGKGLTAFSGVFRPEADRPWYHPIRIDGGGYVQDLGFHQRYAHYHSAVLPIYFSVQDEMHTVFFGGMAEEYQDTLGQNQLDTLVPFVSTISVATRNNLGQWTETVLPTSMPGFLGTNMYFIPNPSGNYLHDKILEIPSLTGPMVLAGHLVGGIESPEPNISQTDPSISFAAPRIFKVFVVPGLVATDNGAGEKPFRLGPNPAGGKWSIWGQAVAGADYEIELWDMVGERLQNWTRRGNGYATQWDFESAGLPVGLYYLTITGPNNQKQVFRLRID